MKRGKVPSYFPLGGRNKSVFLVHSRHDARQAQLYDALKRLLAKCDIGIWDYADWNWWRTHMVQRFASDLPGPDDDEVLEILASNPLYRDHFGICEYEEEVDEDEVDTDKLRDMLLQTPAVIVLEMGGQTVSRGVGTEVEVLARCARQRLATMGGIGLIRDNRLGFFSTECPELVGASLDLGEWVGEGDPSADRLGDVAFLVAVFCVRVLALSASRWNAFMGYPSRDLLEPVSRCRERAQKLVGFLPDEPGDAAHAELGGMIETMLLAAHEELRVTTGRGEVFRSSEWADWISDGFGLGLSPRDLSERAHGHILGIADLLHPALDDLVEGMIEEPGFRTADGRRALSARCVLGPAKLLGLWREQDVVGFLTGLVEDRPDSPVARHALFALGAVADRLQPEAAHRLTDFLLRLAQEDEMADEERLEVIASLSKTGTTEASEWLHAYYRDHYDGAGWREKWSLTAALLRVSGRDATAVALRYLDESPVATHARVASMAWLADADKLYDALEKVSRDNVKVQVNLLFSWLKTRNAPALEALPVACESPDPYVVDCAAMFSSDWFDRYEVPAASRDRVVARLAEILDQDDVPPARLAGALVGLVAAGEQGCSDRATDLVKRFLVLEHPTYLANVLRQVGMRVTGWPPPALLDVLLLNPVADVRHAACYVAGHQRRKEHTRALELLQSDMNGVGVGEPLKKVAGPTVGDAAELALARIAGDAPTERLPSIFD